MPNDIKDIKFLRETEIMSFGSVKFKIRKNFNDGGIITGEILFSDYHLPEKMDVMIDVGAHIGGTSILCATMGAEVFAYEPDKENFELLVENVKLNNVEDKVHCFNLAVGGKGKCSIYLNDINSGSYGYYYAETANLEEVEAIPLEGVFSSNKIENCDLLKFDCEGCEYDTFLNRFPEELFSKIGQISMELHFSVKGYESKQLEEKYGADYPARLMEMLGKYYKMDTCGSNASSAKIIIFRK